MAFINNLAPFSVYSNGVIIQTSAPYVRLSGNSFNVGYPTIPNLARGSIVNTTLAEMNNNLAHVCDFSLEAQKNNKLKKFLNAILQSVREAINAAIKAIGSDPTGIVSTAVQFLKSVTKFVNWIQVEIIQPILNFEYLVIIYIQQIQQIINYIQSLPARLLAMLQDCLSKLYALLAGIFSDAINGVAGELLTEAKKTADALRSAYQAANLAVNVLPNQIATSTQTLVTSATQATSPNQIKTFTDGLPAAISSASAYAVATQPQYQRTTP
jgi:hypothetical protein